MKRILREAVAAPKTPATITQPRKKTRSGNASAAGAKSDHASPAARKPLYRPWFWASARVCSCCSRDRPKVFWPKGVAQRNISSTRK